MKWIFLLILFLISLSCSQNESGKLQKILDAEELHIKLNTYGGLGGFSEQRFHLKKGEFESIMIIDEGTDYQTFVRMENKKDLLNTFFKEAFASNNPEKVMSNSCTTGLDYEYVIRSGLTIQTVRPSAKCDSIFKEIIDER